MKKYLKLIEKLFIIVIIIFVTLFLIYGCAGVKTEQKPEQKPLSTVEEKIEQPKKEETPSPQPTPGIRSKPSPPPGPPKVSEPPQVTTPTQPPPPLSSPIRTTKIIWSYVNLREGPGLNFKVIGNVKKGMSLPILGEKGNWLRVKLQNGREAWVTKAATSEASLLPPAGTSKPTPM